MKARIIECTYTLAAARFGAFRTGTFGANFSYRNKETRSEFLESRKNKSKTNKTAYKNTPFEVSLEFLLALGSSRIGRMPKQTG